MKTVAIRGRVVTEREVRDGWSVLVEGGKVSSLSPGTAQAGEVHDYRKSFIVPGFVDLQVNGAFGVDVASEPERLGTLSRSLASTGTTSYLPTIISSPRALYRQVLPALADAFSDQPSAGAQALGVHLEGPFISLERRGAHMEDNLARPDPALLGELLDLAPVKMLTLAPELEGAERLAGIAAATGAVLAAGHTGADYATAYKAFDGVFSAVTHLFNAMSPFHHRAPGVPGAALAHPRVACGIIPDGRHVHPEVVRIAFQLLGSDRLFLVTDSVSAAGMGPGEYTLAGRRISVGEDGAPRLECGALAGSALTMDEAFRNILAFTGCTMPEAVRMASATPAHLAGVAGRKGHLARGCNADLVILAEDLSVRAVYRDGEQVFERNTAS